MPNPPRLDRQAPQETVRSDLERSVPDNLYFYVAGFSLHESLKSLKSTSDRRPNRLV